MSSEQIYERAEYLNQFSMPEAVRQMHRILSQVFFCYECAGLIGARDSRHRHRISEKLRDTGDGNGEERAI